MTKETYRPTVTSRSWLYSIVKLLFFPTVWLFYRRRTYHGKENILPDRPLFFIPNHQNAFMDATAFIPVRFTWQFAFLMRAKTFDNKMAAKFLYGLNMLPIYRQMDGADLHDSNNEVFLNCAWLMERKRPIICWAEGTHSPIRRIRPIKKGPLRFAFAAEERNNWTLDVHFVPVGMNYTDRENFGGDYLANIGKPIPLSAYKALYLENPARAINELKKEIERNLEQLAIHIPLEEYYTEAEQLREMAVNDFALEQGRATTQVKEFEAGTRAVSQAKRLLEEPARAQAIQNRLQRYRSIIDKVNIRDRVFSPAYKPLNPLLAVGIFILLLPVFVAGMAVHALPAFLAQALARKVVRDPAFNSSILWVGATLLFSFTYVLMFLLIGLISGYWWYALASWPAGLLVGGLTLWYKRRWNKFAAEQRFRKFSKTAQGQEALSLRAEIMKALYAA